MSDLSAFSLAGKRIAVTGANTGIGQGIAVAIARAGGTVIGIGRSAMDETGRLVEAQGASFLSAKADIADSAAGVSLLNELMASAPLDGLVNNAGIIRRADAIDFTEDDWDDVMDVNLRSMFFLCQAYGRKCIEAKDRREPTITLWGAASTRTGWPIAEVSLPNSRRASK